MANMATKARYLLDAESKVTLRPEASAALVAAGTVNEAAVSLDALSSYWDNGVVPHEMVDVVFNVSSALFTTNETYNLQVEVADNAGFSVNVLKVAELSNVASKLGQYVLKLDVKTVLKLSPNAKFLRVKSVTVGTAPNLDYSAFLIS
jgi:hypothetical protein